MPVAAAISAAGSIGSALIGASAAKSASSAQAAAAQQALALQQQILQEAQPFISAGTQGVNTLAQLLTPGPNQTAILSQLPGFQFAQDWGQKATQNIGTTLGLGGNTLAAGAKYATGLAQQGFGQYAGLLQNLANTGTNALSSAFGGGATIGNTLGSLGSAQASGILGQANALTGGLGGLTSALSLSSLLSRGGGIYGGGGGSFLGGLSGGLE